MYLSILGKPTDEELVKYPLVHLTSIHEWDPSAATPKEMGASLGM